MILTDEAIEALARDGMIEPFDPERLNPLGYDLTLGTDFRIPRPISHLEAWGYPTDGLVVDPEEFDADLFACATGTYVVMPPHSFVLGVSVEYLQMPKNVMGFCTGRSSLSRCGVTPYITALEPGWEGKLTLEISNNSPWPVKLPANKGIAQVHFFKGRMPRRTYQGRYQNQEGLTLARGL